MKDEDIDTHLRQHLSGDQPREEFKQETLRDSTAEFVRVGRRRSAWRRAELAAASILIAGVAFLGGRLLAPPALPGNVDVMPQAAAKPDGITVPTDLVAWLDAARLFKRLGMEERMDMLPRQLSGGQQQRVAIARSLINQPTLVLADEPTASLDTERAYQVVETLANLVHEQNRAGIMVTHDLRMVEFADRIIHMLDGGVERIITPQDDLSCLADPGVCTMIPADTLGVGEQ